MGAGRKKEVNTRCEVHVVRREGSRTTYDPIDAFHRAGRSSKLASPTPPPRVRVRPPRLAHTYVLLAQNVDVDL